MAVSLDDLVRSWLVDLQERNLSENTVPIYEAAMRSVRSLATVNGTSSTR